jgi:hypothetical protein
MINHSKASYYFPEPYAGTVKIGDTENTIIAVATELELNTIIKRFGDWVITTNGIDCLTKDCSIKTSQIDEENWVTKLSDEWWVNSGDFELIYYSAKDLMRLGVLKDMIE